MIDSTFNDEAEHCFDLSAVKTVGEGTYGEHEEISGPYNFQMKAHAQVVSAVA
jgi:hypothetical protein